MVPDTVRVFEGNNFCIVEGGADRCDDVVDLFRRVGEGNGWLYPPTARLKQVGSLSNWVWLSGGASRWDALSTEGEVVGSVQVQFVGGDAASGFLGSGELLRFQDLAAKVAVVLGGDVPVGSLGVVQRLAVDPEFRGLGCGSALLGVARKSIGEAGLVCVLEVLTTQVEALSLYVREGGVVVGDFVGRSGSKILQLWLPEVSATGPQ